MRSQSVSLYSRIAIMAAGPCRFSLVKSSWTIAGYNVSLRQHDFAAHPHRSYLPDGADRLRRLPARAKQARQGNGREYRLGSIASHKTGQAASSVHKALAGF